MLAFANVRNYLRAMAAARSHRKSPLDHDPAALRYALDKSGLTQRQFAAAIKKSPSYVSEILKGDRNAAPHLLLVMAEALNCPVVVIEAKRQVLA